MIYMINISYRYIYIIYPRGNTEGGDLHSIHALVR